MAQLAAMAAIRHSRIELTLNFYTDLRAAGRGRSSGIAAESRA
jgi:hypothetical protein